MTPSIGVVFVLFCLSGVFSKSLFAPSGIEQFQLPPKYRTPAILSCLANTENLQPCDFLHAVLRCILQVSDTKCKHPSPRPEVLVPLPPTDPTEPSIWVQPRPTPPGIIFPGQDPDTIIITEGPGFPGLIPGIWPNPPSRGPTIGPGGIIIYPGTDPKPGLPPTRFIIPPTMLPGPEVGIIVPPSGPAKPPGQVLVEERPGYPSGPPSTGGGHPPRRPVLPPGPGVPSGPRPGGEGKPPGIIGNTGMGLVPTGPNPSSTGGGGVGTGPRPGGEGNPPGRPSGPRPGGEGNLPGGPAGSTGTGVPGLPGLPGGPNPPSTGGFGVILPPGGGSAGPGVPGLPGGPNPPSTGGFGVIYPTGGGTPGNPLMPTYPPPTGPSLGPEYPPRQVGIYELIGVPAYPTIYPGGVMTTAYGKIIPAETMYNPTSSMIPPSAGSQITMRTSPEDGKKNNIRDPKSRTTEGESDEHIPEDSSPVDTGPLPILGSGDPTGVTADPLESTNPTLDSHGPFVDTGFPVDHGPFVDPDFTVDHGPSVDPDFIVGHGPFVDTGFPVGHGPFGDTGFPVGHGPFVDTGFPVGHGPFGDTGFPVGHGPFVDPGFAGPSGFGQFPSRPFNPFGNYPFYGMPDTFPYEFGDKNCICRKNIEIPPIVEPINKEETADAESNPKATSEKNTEELKPNLN